MSLNQDCDISAAIIAQLVASYTQPTLPGIVSAPKMVQIKRSSKVSQATVVTASAKSTVSNDIVAQHAASCNARDARPAPATLDLPAVGTLSAKEFIVAMRRAATRDHKIQALAGYVGYDVREVFGVQEQSATMKAQREIRGNPVALKLPVHSALPTLKGYVAGAVDANAKRLADLRGREVLAVDSILTLQKEAAEHLERGDEINAAYSVQLAQVESERLTNIRRDLASF